MTTKLPLLVISGPSGSGKRTFRKYLCRDYPRTFGYSVSYTSRKPRAGEVNGVDYHFLSRVEMEQAIDRGEFLETVEINGHLYGTSNAVVQSIEKQGKVCILFINIEGVQQIRAINSNLLSVFLMPPSIEALRTRLTSVKENAPEMLEERLKRAEDEMVYAKVEGNFHQIVNNRFLKKAYSEFRDFVIGELGRRKAEGVEIEIVSSRRQ